MNTCEYLAHGGHAMAHAVSALAVANGKKVNRAWIVTNPVERLIERAVDAMSAK